MLGIKRITIKNFRQFQNINLQFDSKQGVFLFIGKNGMGKSNFLNAICWCLYEKQPFKFHDEEKGLLNESALIQNKDKEVKVSIEIEQDDKRFFFQRSIKNNESPVFTVMIKNGENWDPYESPSLILNNFLPESVSRFFFFDGEAVQNLFKGDYADNLKEGIMKVSNVELLDKSIEHLERMESDYRKSLSKDLPETSILNSQLNKLIENRDSLAKQLLNKQELLGVTRENIADLMKELAINSKYKDLQVQRQNLSQLLNESEERTKIYQKQINDSILKNASFYFIQDFLVQVSNKITESSLKGKLPPKIKPTFIREIVDIKKCICGTVIELNSKEHACLVKLLEEVEPLDNRSFLIDDKAELNLILRDLSEWPQYLAVIRKRVASEIEQKTIYQQKLKEISDKLKGAQDIGVGNLERTIQKFSEDVEKIHQEIGSCKTQISIYEAQIKEHSTRLDKLNSEKNKNKNIQTKYEFVKEAKANIDLIRKKMIDEIREMVSSKTSTYFNQLMWDKSKFKNITFSKEYEVSVLKDNQEVNHFNRLSTGQTKILALATIKTLAELSGFKNVPVFIDGPLENLDEEVKSNFLSMLPKYMPFKQLFIFSTDHPIMYDFAKKNVNKNNFFQFIQDSKENTLIKLSD